MRRNVEVADGQVDHVGEVVKVAISRRPVLDEFDDAVQALTHGIGQRAVDESQDVREVRPEGADERAQRGEATAQGRPSCRRQSTEGMKPVFTYKNQVIDSAKCRWETRIDPFSGKRNRG